MIESVTELRQRVTEAAQPLEHPYKTYDTAAAPRLAGKAHPYGKLVYAEGGHVGGKFGSKKTPRYLVARGADHDESILALAFELGLSTLDIGVQVEEVDAEWFWLFTNPGGRLPAGQ